MDLLSGVDEENAGTYAGLLGSSFMIGRAVSSYAWGKWADTYGRTTVLYVSLALSGIFSILFGMAQSFTVALVVRSLLGLSNGIIGTAKTLVSELAHGNERLETRGMGLVIGMRGWGFLVSPALSGILAEPARQYPNAKWAQQRGCFQAYPFLLPNIVGAGFCVFSMIAVKLYVQETLPRDKLKSAKFIHHDCIAWWIAYSRKMLLRQSEQEETIPIQTVQFSNYASSSTLEEPPSGSSIQASQGQSQSTAEATMASIWSRLDTRRHLIIYWLYSFVIISVDEAFPLFCISKEAGLGLSEASIGKILSFSGLIFACCQYCVFSFTVHRVGIYGSIVIATIVSVPSIALIPLSLFFNSDDRVTWSLYCYLSILMAVFRVFANVFFSSITIATNRTVPASHRGTMNGLSMLGASCAKGAGPALAGLFVAFCVSSGVFSAHVGAVVVFAVMSFLACLVAVPCATSLEKSRDLDNNGE